MADKKENELLGGVPARLRGLAANGDSISPTMEEVTSAMPVATETSKGLMGNEEAMILNSMSISYGVSGGNSTKFIRLGQFPKDHYTPTRITLSYGHWNSTTRPNIDLTITNTGTEVVCSGNGDGLIGYVPSSGEIFFKCPVVYSFVGVVVGGFIKGREIFTVEPEGIIYVE